MILTSFRNNRGGNLFSEGRLVFERFDNLDADNLNSGLEGFGDETSGQSALDRMQRSMVEGAAGVARKQASLEGQREALKKTEAIVSKVSEEEGGLTKLKELLKQMGDFRGQYREVFAG